MTEKMICEPFIRINSIMRNKLKPNLDLETIQKQLLEEIVSEYDHIGSINKTAKSLGLSNMKVRKALITAGVYSNETSEEVEQSLAACIFRPHRALCTEV